MAREEPAYRGGILTRSSLLALAGVLACASCANPLPFGPGRVEVSVTKASVVTTSPAQRIRYPLQDPATFPRESLPLAIDFELVSRTDLAWYFAEDWHKGIQVECSVVGADDGREYRSAGSIYYGPIDPSEARRFEAFGALPYFDMVDLSRVRRNSRQGEIHLSPGPDGMFHYGVYAFLDLKVPDVEYVMGSPRGTLDLAIQRFESIGCYVRGITMLDPIIPRTNTFSMTYSEFVRELKAVKRAD